MSLVCFSIIGSWSNGRGASIWIGWLRDNLQWYRFAPQETWLGALDITVTGLFYRQDQLGRERNRRQDGVTIVVLWDGWGAPTDPCTFDVDEALKDYGAPDPS